MARTTDTEDTGDYGDILNRSWNEIPEPQTLPNGSWVLKGRNASYVAAREEGKNSKVLFFYTPTEPTDDVDREALAELGDGYDISQNQIAYTIWIEFAKDWDKVRKHLAKHGVDVDSMTIDQSLKAFKNTIVVANLEQRSYTNNAGETVLENSPSNFAAVE